MSCTYLKNGRCALAEQLVESACGLTIEVPARENFCTRCLDLQRTQLVTLEASGPWPVNQAGNALQAAMTSGSVPPDALKRFLEAFGSRLRKVADLEQSSGPLGVGGHLKKLFAERFGWPPCQLCHETAAEMDKLGPEGCRRELDRLAAKIEQNSRVVLANQPGLKARLLKLAPGALKRAGIRRLVVEAITLAERQEGKQTQARPMFVASPRDAAAAEEDADAEEDEPPFPAAPKIAAIVPLFNPAGFQRRTENYLRAMEHYKTLGFDRLLTIEAVFPGQKWAAVGDRIVIDAHDGQRLWQKERLVNIGIEALAVDPPDAVAWLDADLEWDQPERLRETLSLALQQYHVVQPFYEVAWLSESGGIERTYNSWARRKSGRRTPGFAWCARWSLIRRGLFDQAIVGGADAYMACAWSGDPIHPKQTMPPALHAAWEKWRPQRIVTVGDVHLRIRHHWHGRRSDRGYVQRIGFLRRHEFDPFHDIRIADNKLWEWTGRNPALIAAEAMYFARRREDGVRT